MRRTALYLNSQKISGKKAQFVAIAPRHVSDLKHGVVRSNIMRPKILIILININDFGIRFLGPDSGLAVVFLISPMQFT